MQATVCLYLCLCFRVCVCVCVCVRQLSSVRRSLCPCDEPLCALTGCSASSVSSNSCWSFFLVKSISRMARLYFIRHSPPEGKAYNSENVCVTFGCLQPLMQAQQLTLRKRRKRSERMDAVNHEVHCAGCDGCYIQGPK